MTYFITRLERFIIHDQCFPITKIKTKYNNRKPWLTEGLRSSIKSKNKLYRKYKKVDSVANETTHKLYKNKLKKCLISAEKSYYFELIKKHKNNLRKSWNVIKSIINKAV